MSKNRWDITSYTGVSRAAMSVGCDLPQDQYGNLDPTQLPEFDVFDVRTYAHLAGYSDYKYFVRSVVETPGAFTFQRMELDLPAKRKRPVSIYMTTASSAVFEGQRFRDDQRQKLGEKARRQMLLVSSGHLIR